MPPLRTTIWLPDSNQTASGKPGMLQSGAALSFQRSLRIDCLRFLHLVAWAN